MHIEKLATQKEIRRKLELENQITRAEVLNRAETMRVLAMISDAMVSRIMACGMDRAAKEDLLKELSSVPLVLQEVADRQSRN